MALAAALLLSAGWRVASRLETSGLERAAVTVTVAAAAATIETLLLGLLSLSSNGPLLLTIALVTALAARWWLPVPDLSLAQDLSIWWKSASGSTLIAVGAGVGAFCCLLVTTFLLPQFPFDATNYHYPEVIDWIHSGRAGSNITVNYDYPFGDYPLGGEVLMAWGAGMARSFVPMLLVKILGFPLFVVAMVLLLRKVSDSLGLKFLAIAALLLQPIMIYSTADYTGDVLAVAWSALSVAFALEAARDARLFGPALLAGGLAAGTKPTALLPLVIVLTWSCWTYRGALREELSTTLPLGLAGLLIGGIWMTRNTIVHGWPLWPQQAAPWGDRLPPLFKDFNTRLIDSPWETLAHDPGLLLPPVVGTLILLGAGLLTPLWKPTKRTLLGAVLLLVTVALWTATPGTGIVDAAVSVSFGPIGYPLSELRYLIPAAVIAATCLTASGSRGWRALMVSAILAVSAGISLLASANVIEAPFYSTSPQFRFLVLPFLAATAFGSSLLWSLGRITTRDAAPTGAENPPWPAASAAAHRPKAAAAAIMLVSITMLGLLGAWSAEGIVGRWAKNPYAGNTEAPDIGLRPNDAGETAAQALVSQPAWRQGSEPVAFAARLMIAPFAGDSLKHRLVLVPKDATCTEVGRRATGGWLVVARPDYLAPSSGALANRYSGWDCAAPHAPQYGGIPRIYRIDGKWLSDKALSQTPPP